MNTYTGSATIYISGTLLIKNSSMCQAVERRDLHDERLESGATHARLRGQRQRLRRLSAEPGLGGDSVQLVSAYAQGALYATNAIDLGTTSQFDGPLDGSTVMLGQSTSSFFPGFTFVPAGMPGNPEVYAQPQPPQLYAG